MAFRPHAKSPKVDAPSPAEYPAIVHTECISTNGCGSIVISQGGS